MQLPRNCFSQAIAVADQQIGFCNGFAAEVGATAGHDWALIDMEHSANDDFSVLGQLQALAATDATARVRVQWNHPVAVKRLLELGAPGLLVPMIQSTQEARRAVAATLSEPKGVQRGAGATRATAFDRTTDDADRVEEETAVFVQIETRAAVDQAEEIAAVDGVSGIVFKPAELAADMGKVGKPMDPEVWALIKPAVGALSARGMAVGILVLDPPFAAEVQNEGVTFVAIGTDTGMRACASDAVLARTVGALA